MNAPEPIDLAAWFDNEAMEQERDAALARVAELEAEVERLLEKSREAQSSLRRVRRRYDPTFERCSGPGYCLGSDECDGH